MLDYISDSWDTAQTCPKSVSKKKKNPRLKVHYVTFGAPAVKKQNCMWLAEEHSLLFSTPQIQDKMVWKMDSWYTRSLYKFCNFWTKKVTYSVPLRWLPDYTITQM